MNCTHAQLVNQATPCMQYFNGLVARFLMFAAMYRIQKWVTFGSFLGQTDEAYWVSRSSGSLSVTQLQCWFA